MEFFTQVGVLSGLAVLALHQILKLRIVPWQFANKYPVPVLIALSIVATIVAYLADWEDPSSIGEWILLFATIGIVAAVTYNATLRNWKELRESESKIEG